MEELQPKISLVEIIFIVPLCIIGDLLDIIPGVNDVVGVIFTAFLQGYLWFKGVKGLYALVGNLLSFIPGVSAVPLHTLSFAVTAWIDHHPEGAAAAAVQKIPKIKTPKGALAQSAGK